MALSASFKKSVDGDESASSNEEGPSGRRRQLYILYLLNDLLHHTKYHSVSSLAQSTLTVGLQSHLTALLGHASAYNPDVYASQHRKIKGLLDIWETNGYYQSSHVGVLRDTVSNAAKLGFTKNDGESKSSNSVGNEAFGEERREAPYTMPASHGDLSTPFYDLPAGNLLPHILPNSATPINPQLVKPLQFVAGPADESLATAVNNFLQKVESLDGMSFGDEAKNMDLDELGQSVLRDEITGHVLEGEGYYGWSRAFCERMKRRGEGAEDFTKVARRDISTDRSLSPRKRRRYSDSGSSRNRGRSRSSSLGPREGTRYWNEQRSLSRSGSRSRDKRQYRSLRSRSRSISRSASYSPPQTMPAFQQPVSVMHTQPSFQTPPQGPSPPPPPFPHAFAQSFPLGPGGVPTPPPPPPNYQGQWPPPPPPLPNPNATSPPNFAPTPPPPTGPRVYHNQGPPPFPPGPQSNFQGQMQQHPGAWGQPPPSGGYLQGVRGRAAPPFNGNGPNGRGRGFGRGSWGR